MGVTVPAHHYYPADKAQAWRSMSQKLPVLGLNGQILSIQDNATPVDEFIISNKPEHRVHLSRNER
ncbi:MAG: hypothetical protein HC849_19615 [Oscillatoriales cyanobacterium RU_3_3]|nr:hypothetical protein [Oscillatoriales cyanobacterium RU_3_3]